MKIDRGIKSENKDKEKIISVQEWLKIYFTLLIPLYGIVYWIFLVVGGKKGKTVQNKMISGILSIYSWSLVLYSLLSLVWVLLFQKK